MNVERISERAEKILHLLASERRNVYSPGRRLLRRSVRAEQMRVCQKPDR
jgi:hypothetical protein